MDKFVPVPEEHKKRKMMGVHMPMAMFKEIKSLADDAGLTTSAFAMQALRFALDNMEKRNA